MEWAKCHNDINIVKLFIFFTRVFVDHYTPHTHGRITERLNFLSCK